MKSIFIHLQRVLPSPAEPFASCPQKYVVRPKLNEFGSDRQILILWSKVALDNWKQLNNYKQPFENKLPSLFMWRLINKGSCDDAVSF